MSKSCQKSVKNVSKNLSIISPFAQIVRREEGEEDQVATSSHLVKRMLKIKKGCFRSQIRYSICTSPAAGKTVLAQIEAGVDGGLYLVTTYLN
jgi:hypothetical protein